MFQGAQSKCRIQDAEGVQGAGPLWGLSPRWCRHLTGR